ncbi:hypothetical protein K0U83_21485 [bacterium]|nr:hypothetical protein [bacterium]
MTPTFTAEEVRLQLLAHIQEIPGIGWKPSRHAFTDRELQGNVLGDRTFGIRIGASAPKDSQRRGAERVQTVYTVRLRHRIPVKDGQDARQQYAMDVRTVENWVRTPGVKMDGSIQMEWTGTPEAREVDGAFIDTDVIFRAVYWGRVTGGPDGGG